ncbi:MAG TPA: hypothetical protein VFY99_10995 [Solirubrobacterales bacterium]
MVRRTTGNGTGEIEWHRPRGARAVAETRWSTEGEDAARPDGERPSFFALLVPLVALSLGSVLAIGIAVAILLGLLSLLI